MVIKKQKFYFPYSLWIYSCIILSQEVGSGNGNNYVVVGTHLSLAIMLRNASPTRDVPRRKDRKVKSRREANMKTYRDQRLSSSMTPLGQKILIPRPTNCETVGNPLTAMAVYGTNILGLSQVAWSTVFPQQVLYSD